MTEINNVVLISFGSLEYRDGSYFGKHQIINYIEGFSDNFDNVTFVANRSHKQEYSTELNQELVSPQFSGLELFPDGKEITLSKVLKSYFKSSRILDEETAVIINTPSILFIPILPVLKYRAGRLITYLGANPDQVADLQSNKGPLFGTFLSKCTQLQVDYLVNNSNTVLVRGDPNQYGSNDATKSKPIVHLEKPDEKPSTEDFLEDSIKLLFVGSLQHRKGVDNLIYTVNLLEKQDCEWNFNLLIVGDGDLRQELEELVSELDLEDVVEFVGWVDNENTLAKFYTTASVAVFPSRQAEGQPRVIDEAQFYGTPVITTDLGYGDDFRHKENIYYIEKPNPDTLAESILDLIESETLYRNIRDGGLERANNLLEQTASEQHSELILNK